MKIWSIKNQMNRNTIQALSILVCASLILCGATWEQSALATGKSNGDSSKARATGKKDAAEDDDDDNIIKKPKESSEPVAKQFSPGERNKACAKFNSRLVSVAGEMWKIKDCTRHQIHDADMFFRMSRESGSVVEADARELASIPVGDSWDNILNAKMRPCATFNGKYVTFSYTDIYFVDRCVRRLVPDYETLLQHRRDHNSKSTDVLALSEMEFHSLKQGRDLPSEVDKEFAKLLNGAAGVDLIPVDEACRGVDGKLVSFYSRLYRIEKCRKREIDAESFTMKRRTLDAKIVELKPEQWLSLPDGKPMKD